MEILALQGCTIATEFCCSIEERVVDKGEDGTLNFRDVRILRVCACVLFDYYSKTPKRVALQQTA